VRAHFHIGVAIALTCAIPRLQATEDTGLDREPYGEPYAKGTREIEATFGAFGSFSIGPSRQTVDFGFESLRLGWMATTPQGGGWLRGNNEFLLEGFTAEILRGPGHVLAGATIIWRYNFVQTGVRLVPYLQLGGGGLYSDIYKDRSQLLAGDAFEFILHNGIGLRYALTNQWSASVEGAYRHMSNAGFSGRNQGLNSFGGTFGLICSF
jgi:hypothetical protein